MRVPARDVLVAVQPPTGLSARNLLPGRIAAIGTGAAAVMVEIDCAGVRLAARLTRASARDLGLVVGTPVFAVVKSVAFDPQEIGQAAPASRPVEI